MAFAALASLSSCGQPGARVTLVLQRHESATLDGMNALRVNVRQVCQPDPEVFQPFGVDRSQNLTLSTEVPPGEPFYADIWGCSSTTSCRPEDVIARGCTDVVVLPEGSREQVVGVVMYDQPGDPVAPCPPDTTEARANFCPMMNMIAGN